MCFECMYIIYFLFVFNYLNNNNNNNILRYNLYYGFPKNILNNLLIFFWQKTVMPWEAPNTIRNLQSSLRIITPDYLSIHPRSTAHKYIALIIPILYYRLRTVISNVKYWPRFLSNNVRYGIRTPRVPLGSTGQVMQQALTFRDWIWSTLDFTTSSRTCFISPSLHCNTQTWRSCTMV